MNIFAFKKNMSIRELGIIEDDKLNISIIGVPDGEQITVKASSGRYTVGLLKDHEVSFPADFFKPGESYTVYCGDRTASFNFSNGAFYHIYDGVTAEITKMWATIVDLAEEIKSVDGKISKFVDGYETE